MKSFKFTFSLLALAALSACGGGSQQTAQTKANVLLSERVVSGGTAVQGAITPAAAAHFLAQASFGPTSASIAEVAANGQDAWLTTQFSMPQSSQRALTSRFAATLTNSADLNSSMFQSTFWQQAVTADDQLRQRVAYSLSQIFVISAVDGSLYFHPYGVADYYDTLGRYAFGNFRDLLEAVALHPMMGLYLSSMHNQKESGPRVPDENFAREIMQLMSIGLYQLNLDGSQKIRNGKPIETYTHDDIVGLSKVFTGWSWAGPDQSSGRFFGNPADANRDWTPMQNYTAYHSTSDKSFLGVHLAAGGSGAADLKVALDTLFNHPNVGPFISKQLIQRLVMSNPTAAYILRISQVFANNGAGVRGDMKAVIRAILLDPDAQESVKTKKLREPVLRLSNWLRAFNATSTSGYYKSWRLDDPGIGLAQSPLRSPSVFNFYRPTYSPPNSLLAEWSLVSPEMQITSEPSVIGYLNYMQSAIFMGVGMDFDIQPNYVTELTLTATPDQLVDRVNLLMLSGGMSATLRSQIIAAVTAVPQPVPNASNAAQVLQQKKYRVYTAIFLAMASPEYLVQR